MRGYSDRRWRVTICRAFHYGIWATVLTAKHGSMRSKASVECISTLRFTSFANRSGSHLTNRLTWPGSQPQTDRVEILASDSTDLTPPCSLHDPWKRPRATGGKDPNLVGMPPTDRQPLPKGYREGTSWDGQPLAESHDLFLVVMCLVRGRNGRIRSRRRCRCPLDTWSDSVRMGRYYYPMRSRQSSHGD